MREQRPIAAAWLRCQRALRPGLRRLAEPGGGPPGAPDGARWLAQQLRPAVVLVTPGAYTGQAGLATGSRSDSAASNRRRS